MDRPRNSIGTELADDGRPVFNTETGESRQQYLARVREENRKTLLDDLAAAATAEPTATPKTTTTKSAKE